MLDGMRRATFACWSLGTHYHRVFQSCNTALLLSRGASSDLTMTAATVDVARVRNDMLDATGTVQLNSAGDSPMPRAVLERVTEHLRTEATVGGYEAAARCQEEIESVYNNAALLVNARANEIALQESASMAWARAFYALAQGLNPGDRILTGVVEYGANYVAMLQVSKRTGAVIEVVPSDEAGELDLEALERMLKAGGVKAVAITHVPTNGGVVNPAKEVGALCKQFGVLYILDACQSVGQLAVDVEEIGCHMLCATGRKFLRGPRGTGFLYISREIMDSIGEPPMIDHFAAPCVARDRYEVRPDARRFEFWESNIAGRLGLGVAIRYALDIGLEKIETRVRQLAADLRLKLAAVEEVVLLDLGRPERQCGIVSFSVRGVDAGEIKQGLRARGVYLSISSADGTPLDAKKRALPTVLRASVHYFNNDEDLKKFIGALRSVVQEAKSASSS